MKLIAHIKIIALPKPKYFKLKYKYSFGGNPFGDISNLNLSLSPKRVKSILLFIIHSPTYLDVIYKFTWCFVAFSP